MVSLQGVIYHLQLGVTMAQYLEQRRGYYYFRQVAMINGKQKAKRISLKTKDLKIAKMLSIQILASIFQMNKKFEVQYDDNNNIKSINVKDEADHRLYMEYEEMRQKHLAFKHKQELEKLEAQAKIKKEEDERKSKEWQESDRANLFEMLNATLATKPPKNTKKLIEYLEEYLKTVSVKNQQTHDKYRRVNTQLIEYCQTQGVDTPHGVTRELVWSYINFLKADGKSDKTIKNLFYTQGSFYNHLLRIGATKEPNPFTGHKFNVEKTKRIPFTIEELNKIFSCQKIKDKTSLFYVCLIMLTSGARPSEICQLWHDDINKVDDYYTIRIVENPQREQTLKTPQSKRLIYLHPLVIKHGFLEYLETRKGRNIFDIPKAKGKNISKLISEDFSEILRKTLNIEVKTLYYFRHTVINRIKAKGAEVPNIKEITKDMIGHDDDDDDKQKTDTMLEHYEQLYPPSILKKATESLLNYEEVKALN
ncbi:hypothetical protein [Achromobacter sp. AONIH1]|uniref:phage integrase SAM-like domain-containing protein n=1 Tax=Achromobacter sp. AONIH1 TaxID=1758194 RepID=UPI001319F8A4|nr:hypothetical protein [Achromobacter sp. AONIH1]